MAKTQSGILIKGVEIAGDVPTACTTMWAPCVLTTLLKYTSETTDTDDTKNTGFKNV